MTSQVAPSGVIIAEVHSTGPSFKSLHDSRSSGYFVRAGHSKQNVIKSTEFNEAIVIKNYCIFNTHANPWLASFGGMRRHKELEE